MKNIDLESMRHRIHRIQAAADPLAGCRKTTEVYRLIEHELISCRGLLDAAMEISLYRHEHSGNPDSYDGMTEVISQVIVIVEEIEHKLTQERLSA